MSEYYIAFHGGKGRMMDTVIVWATRSRFAHCELIRCDRRPRDGETHRCIGASLMDGGVRVKAITFDPGKWRFVHIPFAPKNTWNRALRHVGRPYDLQAFIWTHLFNFRRQARDKWFCSELIAEALDLNMPHAYSPGDLRRAVIDHRRTWSRARIDLAESEMNPAEEARRLREENERLKAAEKRRRRNRSADRGAREDATRVTLN
ncbi:hypothetical protein MWU52_15500 [Jannaschia sp. S6380]|uniref:hypothetical protein n=1 Tax=Jannaschia sp. S6380 TaxID=2926408 RepID=UPI001FF37F2A|nr:hypothetical protein [Jannaschia sp. S6380]MCK0168960.1 hypothetical protein [Jannaschia sp. S6380]